MIRFKMIGLFLAVVICLSGRDGSPCAADESQIRPAVVKVWASARTLNLSSPWKRGTVTNRSGSGIWIGDNRILTNAHVVTYAAQVSVQKHQSAERLSAKVVIASHEMDLAILELDEPASFSEVTPVMFAETLPKLQSPVQVYGYPTGGETMSVTEGVVSRIEYRSYSHGAKGLRIQVDAAINPGNSGGPALVDDEVIGIAFQKRTRSDNIGYLIPSDEVQTFLADVADGHYEGKPHLRVTYQKLLNRGLRASLNLSSEVTGVVIREVLSSNENFPLMVGDVVTHIGPHDVDNSGVAKFATDLRFDLSFFVTQLTSEGAVPLTILRDGEELKLEVPVEFLPDKLFRTLKGEYPEYFVYGPLAFVEGTADYMNALEASALSSDATTRARAIAGLRVLAVRKSPIVGRRYDEPAFEGEQMVMVSHSLPHRISLGYGSPATSIVKAVNGTNIRNMKHLVELLRDLESEYVKFEFASEQTEIIVFDRKELVAATEDIVGDNGISRVASPDLLELWERE